VDEVRDQKHRREDERRRHGSSVESDALLLDERVAEEKTDRGAGVQRGIQRRERIGLARGERNTPRYR